MGRTFKRIITVWILIALVVGGYFLKPVSAPDRDLNLASDVVRGVYVMRLAGCAACHTDAKVGGAYLAGGAPLTTPFGDFVPPNITPDVEAGIGDWSLAQFADAMTIGQGPRYKHLYPAFPFDLYTKMSDQDIVDLWAALRAVPAINVKAADHSIRFPFNIRLAMQGWKVLFLDTKRTQRQPDKSALWNRGAYLANGPAHCGACHTPRNRFGARNAALEFSGTSKESPGGRVPDISAAALAARDYGVDELMEVLSSGFTPDFDVLGEAMAEVIAEGTSHWSADDRRAIATYLLDR